MRLFQTTAVALLMSLAIPHAGVAQTLSQQLKKAPNGLEEALRQRVANFYQSLVDKRFRDAEDMMLQESRAIFYEMQKTKYEGFRIEEIKYNDDYSEAEVLVALDYLFVSPRVGRMNQVLPAWGNWKYQDGQWWFYYKKVTSRDSPFGGKWTPGPYPEAGEQFQTRKDMTVEQLTAAVKLSKREFQLSGDAAAEDSVTITNGLGSDVEVDLTVGTVGDTSITLDKRVIKPGQTATMTARCEPEVKGPRSPLTFMFEIKPLGIRYSMKVSYRSMIPVNNIPGKQ